MSGRGFFSAFATNKSAFEKADALVDSILDLQKKKKRYESGEGEARSLTDQRRQTKVVAISNNIDAKLLSLRTAVDAYIDENIEQLSQIYPGVPKEMIRFECLTRIIRGKGQEPEDYQRASETARSLTKGAEGMFQELTAENDPLLKYMKNGLNEGQDIIQKLRDYQDSFSDLHEQEMKSYGNRLYNWNGPPEPGVEKSQTHLMLEDLDAAITTIAKFLPDYKNPTSRVEIGDKLCDAFAKIFELMRPAEKWPSNPDTSVSGRITKDEIRKCMILCGHTPNNSSNVTKNSGPESRKFHV